MVLTSSQCSRKFTASPDTPEALWEDTVLEVTLRSGATITLRSITFSGDSLRGLKGSDRSPTAIANQDIVSIRNKSVGTVSGVLVLAMGVATTLVFREVFEEHHHHHASGSCPYIYAFDGEQYQLDAELIAGSISRSLQATDYAPLEHLRVENGYARLRLSNELLEVHYVDRLSLVLVEHARGYRVLLDEHGQPHTLSAVIPPQSALDAQGRDWTESVTFADALNWGSSLDDLDIQDSESLRSRLIVEFDAPESLKSAKLVVRAKNTVLAQQAITDLGLLVHPNFSGWLSTLDTDSASLALFQEQWEQSLLEIEYLGQDGWISIGTLPSVGPAVERTQVVLLDSLRDIGTKITLRLGVLAGAWEINQIGIDYSPDESVSKSEVLPAISGVHNGPDISDLLSAEDNRYLFIGPGVSHDLEFPINSASEGQIHSLFVSLSGYYHPIRPGKSGQYRDQIVQRFLDQSEYSRQISAILLSMFPELQATLLPKLLSRAN